MTDQPAKVELQTPDLTADNRAAFERLFPGVIRDGVLDVNRLGDLIDTPLSEVADGRERFGLTWAGKQHAIESLRTPSKAALLPEFDKSLGDFDSSEHVFIEGDNLEVLKLLQKAYNDRVKLIYIDPPYNTGSNDFIYPDDFSDSLRAYLEFTGQIDADGNRRYAATDTAGRRHSKWLSMMYPRLVLARNLLMQDGVIFVSIDDNEIANLRELMDEVFGAENFIASVIWQKVYSPKSTARHFSEDHDYIVVYARSADAWTPNLLPRTAEMDQAYKNPDGDHRGLWKSTDLSARNYYGAGTYAVTSPSGRLIPGPPPGRYWVISEEKFKQFDADGRIWWGRDGNAMPAKKTYLTEVKQGRVPQTFWPYSEVGHNQDAKKELLKRVTFESSGSVFDTPKPTQLIRRMLTLATTANDGDVVMDFFAGSGSTADAVLQQNAEDGGSRRFVSVQLPEPTGHDDFKLVSDITRARIGAALKDVAPAVGLRTYRMAASLFHPEPSDGERDLFDFRTSTLNSDQVSEQIAGEVLLREGVTLDAPWQRDKVSGAKVIIADGVAVVLSLNITDEMTASALALKPRVIVFLEDGFAGRDAVKANAFTNAKNAGITMKTV